MYVLDLSPADLLFSAAKLDADRSCKHVPYALP
jgi:hypothetical protein